MLVNLHLICLLIKLQTPQPASLNSLLTPPTCHCPLSSHRNPVAIADNNFNLGQLQLQLEVGRAKRNESILAVRRFFSRLDFVVAVAVVVARFALSLRERCCRSVSKPVTATTNNNHSSSNDKTTPTTRAIHFLMMHIKNIRKKASFSFFHLQYLFFVPFDADRKQQKVTTNLERVKNTTTKLNVLS